MHETGAPGMRKNDPKNAQRAHGASAHRMRTKQIEMTQLATDSWILAADSEKAPSPQASDAMRETTQEKVESRAIGMIARDLTTHPIHETEALVKADLADKRMSADRENRQHSGGFSSRAEPNAPHFDQVASRRVEQSRRLLYRQRIDTRKRA